MLRCCVYARTYLTSFAGRRHAPQCLMAAVRAGRYVADENWEAPMKKFRKIVSNGISKQAARAELAAALAAYTPDDNGARVSTRAAARP